MSTEQEVPGSSPGQGTSDHMNRYNMLTRGVTSHLQCLEGLEDGQAEDRQLRPASNTGAPSGAVGSTPTLSARQDVVLASTVIAWLWRIKDLLLILMVLHLLSQV